MAHQPLSPARLTFGPFEVNVPAEQLLKSGVRIRLSGQPFQILLILLAHPGDVVRRSRTGPSYRIQGGRSSGGGVQDQYAEMSGRRTPGRPLRGSK